MLAHAVENCTDSVQVGDFGIGFIRDIDRADEILRSGNHRFIRGNHDNPEHVKEWDQYIPDGTVEGDMMYVGGAWSIDYLYRIPGVTWWPEEELSYEELATISDVYAATKPKIMVTHDCPTSVAHELSCEGLPAGSITQGLPKRCNRC